MNSTSFLLGQIGLFCAAIFSVGIIHIVGQLPTRPKWYYFVVVWLVACGCVFLFTQPYVSPRMEALPSAAYWFRFLFGVERMAVFCNYYFRSGPQLTTQFIVRANGYIGTAIITIMLMAALYALYDTNEQSKQEALTLQKEQIQVTKQFNAQQEKATEARKVILTKVDSLKQKQDTVLSAVLTKIKSDSIRQARFMQELKALQKGDPPTKRPPQRPNTPVIQQPIPPINREKPKNIFQKLFGRRRTADTTAYLHSGTRASIDTLASY